MANQIAANSDYGPDKKKLAATVADHLTRFWTPEMRAAIIGATGARSSTSRRWPRSAVEKLAPPKIDAA